MSFKYNRISIKYTFFLLVFGLVVFMLMYLGIQIGAILAQEKNMMGASAFKNTLALINLSFIMMVFIMLAISFVCCLIKSYINLIKFNIKNGLPLPNFITDEDKNIAKILINAELPKEETKNKETEQNAK